VEVPGQEFGDEVDGMIGDAPEHLANICFRIDSIEFRRSDQAIEGGGSFAAAIRSGKEMVLASHGDGAQRTFGAVVIDLEMTVVGKAYRGLPTVSA
jgi:hypothetical protein